MVLCTYLSVNGALEVSVHGGEGVVLGGKVHIHLLQRGLRGGGPGDGRHWEGTDGNLKLGVHGTPLAQDMAGQPRKHEREAEFLGLVSGGREEGLGVLVILDGAESHASLVQGLGSGVTGVGVDAHVDDGGGGALSIPRYGLDQQFFDLLHHTLFGGRPCVWRLKSESFSVKSGVVETMASMRCLRSPSEEVEVAW